MGAPSLSRHSFTLKSINPDSKATVLASLVLTLALVSDAILYLLLPLYFEHFGLTLLWVGILLSANRFVRLLINPWLVPWFEHFGPRSAMLQAVGLAMIAILAFWLVASPWVLLVARLLWGCAYALIRLGCLHYATYHEPRRMVNLGWYTGLQEVGPLLVLAAAPFLVSEFSVSAVLGVACILCMVALAPALALPGSAAERKGNASARIPWPNAWHRLTFMLCLLFDGVWTVVLAPLLVMTGWPTGVALALAAWLLVAKRLFNLSLGMVTVRYNPWRRDNRWLGSAILILAVAGGLMATGNILWASGFGIVGHGLFMILMPKRLADDAPDKIERQHSLNGFTFWRDIAAAIGALLASGLLAWQLATEFYGLFTLLLVIVGFTGKIWKII